MIPGDRSREGRRDAGQPSAEDREEAARIRRTLRGDREAFEGVVRRHWRDLRRFLRGIMRNDQDAEDLCQEAFLRAYRALDRFDLERPFRPWLWTIAARLAFQNLARKERANLSLDAPADPDEPAYEGAWLADESEMRRLDETVLRIDLQEALRELPAEQRAVLLLRVLEERSYDEIAAILEIPVGTVMSRLHRARARLRSKLSDETTGQKERTESRQERKGGSLR